MINVVSIYRKIKPLRVCNELRLYNSGTNLALLLA